jgi:hypothetical protein
MRPNLEGPITRLILEFLSYLLRIDIIRIDSLTTHSTQLCSHLVSVRLLSIPILLRIINHLKCYLLSKLPIGLASLITLL